MCDGPLSDNDQSWVLDVHFLRRSSPRRTEMHGSFVAIFGEVMRDFVGGNTCCGSEDGSALRLAR